MLWLTLDQRGKSHYIQALANAPSIRSSQTTIVKESKELRPQERVDQASWHISDKLNLPENIRLIPQTDRSPELNPVEHLWEAIRENYFYNEVFDSLENVIDTLCESLNFFNSVPEKLKSMTYFPHLRITF
jgi:hypothetical protein